MIPTEVAITNGCLMEDEIDDRISKLTAQLEKLQKLNVELRQENEHLRKRRECSVSVATQTDTDEIVPLQADDIAQVAEEALSTSGYQYDHRTGLYYDTKSGYYYDPYQKLFFEPRSGIYYQFNESTNEYVEHSRADLDDLVKRKEDLVILRGEQHKPPTPMSDDESDSEEGELSSSSEEEVIVEKSAPARYYPPCIRMIVIESNVDSILVGSLHIITCDGGSIGREATLKPTVHIPHSTVNKVHCELTYNRDLSVYLVVDKASESGTFINNNRIGASRVISEPASLRHCDHLRVSTAVTFRCHIHTDHSTCTQCEPIIAVASPPITIDSNSEQVPTVAASIPPLTHKQRLKQLKAKYCLKSTNYEPVRLAKGYSDKAEKRRLTVGSDNPYEPDAAPASVDVPLEHQEPDNKGAKMMAKMGWKSGQALGTGDSDDALTVPLAVLQRANQRAGLGAADGVGVESIQSQKKMRIHMITKERFDKIVTGDEMS